MSTVLSFTLSTMLPERPSVEVRLKQSGRNSFLMTLHNGSERDSAVSVYSLAYEVVLKDDRGRRVGSLDAYLAGWMKEGTLYHAPNVLVPSEMHWALLPAGASLSLPLSAYGIGGPLATAPLRGTRTWSSDRTSRETVFRIG